MGDSWNIIGWAFIVVCVIAALIFGGLITKIYTDQWRTNRKRRRAEAGKLKCEAEGCENIATYTTPNGYFCDDDEGANSKKHSSLGSWQWAHKLPHTLTGG